MQPLRIRPLKRVPIEVRGLSVDGSWDRWRISDDELVLLGPGPYGLWTAIPVYQDEDLEAICLRASYVTTRRELVERLQDFSMMDDSPRAAVFPLRAIYRGLWHTRDNAFVIFKKSTLRQGRKSTVGRWHISATANVIQHTVPPSWKSLMSDKDLSQRIKDWIGENELDLSFTTRKEAATALEQAQVRSPLSSIWR